MIIHAARLIAYFCGKSTKWATGRETFSGPFNLIRDQDLQVAGCLKSKLRVSFRSCEKCELVCLQFIYKRRLSFCIHAVITSTGKKIVENRLPLWFHNKILPFNQNGFFKKNGINEEGTKWKSINKKLVAAYCGQETQGPEVWVGVYVHLWKI